MPTITEAICIGNRRYNLAPVLNPVGVVLHSIGVTQPDANVLRRIWQDDNSIYVVHYVLDDQKILHTFPDNKQAYHVSTPGNSKWLAIEMCETDFITSINKNAGTGGGFTVDDLEKARAYTKDCYENAVWLLAKLCKEHGWDPNTAIYTHYEVTRQKLSNTNHVDPQHLWDGLGMGYSLLTLRRDVAAAMGQAAAAPAPEATAPETSATSGQMYRIRKTWADVASQIGAYTNLEYAKAACKHGYAVFDAAGNQVWPEQAFQPYLVRITAQSGLNVRSGPGTNYGVVMALAYGGGYTIVEEQNGWGKLKSGIGWICLKYTERVV